MIILMTACQKEIKYSPKIDAPICDPSVYVVKDRLMETAKLKTYSTFKITFPEAVEIYRCLDLHTAMIDE